MCGQRFIKIVCLPFLSLEPYCLTAYTYLAASTAYVQTPLARLSIVWNKVLAE